MGVAASRSNAAIRYERKAPHVGPQHAPVLEYPAVGPVTGVADRHDSLQADFVIIGGGTAGCVLADRLSACGRHRVLLIEAGGADRSPWIHIPDRKSGGWGRGVSVRGELGGGRVLHKNTHS